MGKHGRITYYPGLTHYDAAQRYRAAGAREPRVGSWVEVQCLPPLVGIVLDVDRNRERAQVEYTDGGETDTAWFGWVELRLA